MKVSKRPAEMTMLKTTITGSLPRPSWVAEPGKHQFQTWSIPSEYIAEAHDDAVRLAILDQEDAGLDIVTDGEQRRRHYIWGFIEGLNGIDTHRLGKKQTRGGRYTTEAISVARIVGEIMRPRAVLVDALRFAKAQTNKPVKVTLPGPMTIVDSLVDEFYGETTSALARRFAEVLNAEARELAAAGADIIQFDEPCFNIYLEQVAEWGIAMLEKCIEGVTATTAVHICYGYGIPITLAWKSQNRDWGHYGFTLPLLAKSRIDQVSIECAASGVDISVISTLKGKDVMVGVIDVGTDVIETPELVAARIRKALPHVDPGRLYPCTDCGLVPRARNIARGKMRSLAAGAAIVRKEL
jgi:5-methyltetrahydropteroyltriglutamate--homocysteine methyltransferase